MTFEEALQWMKKGKKIKYSAKNGRYITFKMFYGEIFKNDSIEPMDSLRINMIMSDCWELAE